MKKQILALVIGGIIISIITCYSGYRIGHKNGFIEAVLKNDVAFWNLLFLRSESKEELIEFNEESLLGSVVALHAQLNDPFLHGKNKPDLYVNGTKVTFDIFEQEEKELERILQEVWEKDSHVLDLIIEAKKAEAEQSE